ncbi:MAG: hypothetical protein AAB405_02055 [Patescibacteria group bacterium]
MNYIKIYVDFLKKRLHSDKKLKIVFDCSNGTTGLILKELFKTNSLIDYQLINQTPNGDFPAHRPNPLASNALNQLQQEVKKQKVDLGVIFDADGDRVFFIDNLGRFIDPDVISKLLIWHLKPKKIVIDSRTGWLVKRLATKDLRLTTSRAGHYFIKKLMQEIKADFGAEKSGHYYFPISDKKEISYIDSGILTAIEVINAISKLPYSIANFNDLLPQYYRSGEINIELPAENREMKNILKEIEEIFKNQFSNQLKIFYLDGLTIESNEWWFNLRPSNTEPAIRLNIESTKKEIIDNLINKIYSLLNL